MESMLADFKGKFPSETWGYRDHHRKKIENRTILHSFEPGCHYNSLTHLLMKITDQYTSAGQPPLADQVKFRKDVIEMTCPPTDFASADAYETWKASMTNPSTHPDVFFLFGVARHYRIKLMVAYYRRLIEGDTIQMVCLDPTFGEDSSIRSAGIYLYGGAQDGYPQGAQLCNVL